MRVPANVRVDPRHTLSRIDHQQRHIRRLKVLARHNH